MTVTNDGDGAQNKSPPPTETEIDALANIDLEITMSTPSIQWHRLSALICVLTISVSVTVTDSAAAEPEDPRQNVFVPIGPFAAPELDTSSIKKDREEEPADTSTGKETAGDAENEQNRQGGVPDTSIIPVVTSSPADDGTFDAPPNLTDDSEHQPQ